MLYHALALADDGDEVDLVGYDGAHLPREVREHPKVRVHHLGAPAAWRRRLPRPLFVIYAAARAARVWLRLAWMLAVSLPRPDAVLVQNPPAVPALAAALVASWLRPARLVVDWHNFGYTMLALRLGADHPVVGLARRIESLLGRRAAAHLCVSNAMRDELDRAWTIPAIALYDRPAARFAPTPEPARGEIVRRFADEAGFDGSRRRALVVSATSWSADEDFSLLLDAAALCDARARGHSTFPDVVVLVTGAGPGRAAFEERAARLGLERIRLCTAWLAADEYPTVLGAADLGVSVHRSSSGLDVPMKVSDMFGAGLPVCAFDYAPCLSDVVRDGENGLLFTTAEELADRLVELLDESAPLLDRLRRGAAEAARVRWDDEWRAVARPLFVAR